MSTFEYHGYTRDGKSARGLLEALDLKQAREKLLRQGILAESVTRAGRPRSLWWGRRRLFTLDTRAAFYRELASMLAAGLPLTTALGLLVDAPEMGNERAVVAGIRDRIAEGLPLARAVAEAAGGVTQFEQAVIETGEQTGQLDSVLDRLAGFLEEERVLRDRWWGALLYPAVIVVLSVVVAVVMGAVLLPAFRELLLDAGLELPALTRATLFVFGVTVWLLPLALVAGIGLALWGRRHYRRHEGFRLALDRHRYRWPVVGPFYALQSALRFSRTLAMLLTQRVPLLTALVQSGQATGSPWLAQRLEGVADAVKHGEALSTALAGVGPLADRLPGWVRAGEASGDLAGMLGQAAARLQQAWERRIARGMVLLESGLIILVGAGVFLLALSIILPILSLNQTLQ